MIINQVSREILRETMVHGHPVVTYKHVLLGEPEARPYYETLWEGDDKNFWECSRELEDAEMDHSLIVDILLNK